MKSGRAQQGDRPARCEGTIEADRLVLTLEGRLDSRTVADLWPRVRDLLSRSGFSAIEVRGEGVTYCDGAGAALLVYVQRVGRRLGKPVTLNGFSPEVEGLLALYPVERFEEETAPPRSRFDFVTEVGEATVALFRDIFDQISFLGEWLVAQIHVLLHPTSLRWKDLLGIADAAGVRALPIVGLLGFLIGLIMAFQGGVLMKQFGAEIYVADFVGISIVRELGPLITAIIVAGRTGSAFAAEIGTMKVNEEVDALVTMGLDPMRFLVVPRVMAATAMTPLLAIFANLFGMMGGAAVMMGLGFPLVTYVDRAVNAVSLTSFVIGLIKSLVFGMLIAGVGCMAGLQTGEGASAVGRSATRAVVASIVLIVLADGLFSVIFYYLGI